MCFCYADINEHNFIFTNLAERNLYVIGFEHASFLPTSFMSYALFQYMGSFASELGTCLLQIDVISRDGENMRPMVLIRYIFSYYYYFLGKHHGSPIDRLTIIHGFEIGLPV